MHTTLITTEELAARLGAPDLVVCDVRHDLAQPDSWGEAEYRSAHIPGALFVHLDRDLSARKTGTNGRHPLPTPETAAAMFARLGIDSAKQVVVYDQGGGMFAARLWWMLKWLGHDAAALLDGGFAKWVGESRTTSADVPARQAALFTIRRVKPTVNATGVAASLARRSLTLIDARVPERFRGEIEPLDPVAGHIPGARNRPYGSNLNPDGRSSRQPHCARSSQRFWPGHRQVTSSINAAPALPRATTCWRWRSRGCPLRDSTRVRGANGARTRRGRWRAISRLEHAPGV